MLEKLSNNVFYFFEQISKIPRKSGYEQQIVKYLEKFAIERNLNYYIDEYNNIVIFKEATLGQENRLPLAIQAHTDMICEKLLDSKHNFLTDSLELYISGDYIKAKDTTLGADNGIGMAYILAILDSKEIVAPKLECIFTSEEETTMIGAINLDMEKIQSEKIISLDNGKEGKMLVSSAQCDEWICTLPCVTQINEYKYSFELNYKNFKGGHSGGNIGDEKRGNPIKLAIELLKGLDSAVISQIKGGTRVNVIPRDFKIIFVTDDKDTKIKLSSLIDGQKSFYGDDVVIQLNEIANVKDTLEKNISDNIINFIYEFQNGAINRDEVGNVIQSGNMAAVSIEEDTIKLAFSQRSNDKEAEKIYLNNLNELINRYNLSIEWTQNLKGVPKKNENSLENSCKQIYKNMYNEEIESVISQGVVEGGFFVSKKPNIEYICIGPNIYDAHSPTESLSIISTIKIWNYLKEILEKL